METYELKRPDNFKTRKRVGTGPSAGGGKTCGRGMNGQGSRSGYSKRPWFEGGQMPLLRRVPKRGFNNLFKKQFQIINVSQLDKLKETELTPEILKKSGLIDDENALIKILGDGELSKSLKVTADKFTKSAVEKIKAAGGETITR